MAESTTLTTAQVAAPLRAAAVTVRAEAESLGIDGMRWHPAPGEWCVNEVLGHILEVERRSFAGRISQIIERPGRARERGDGSRGEGAGRAGLRTHDQGVVGARQVEAKVGRSLLGNR